jgi:putative ABC transport system permease protein
MISVIISVSISLSIPQVISGTEEYLSNQASKINGGDLKIIESFTSNTFDKKLNELKKTNLEIKESLVYSLNLNYKSNRLYCQLLVGDYNLEPNEIIIYKDIADKLKLNVNDEIELMNQTYIIKGIDNNAFGVDQTSEMFGYCKVSAYNTVNNIPITKIVYINGDNIEKVKEDLMKIEPNFSFTTIKDQNDLIKEKLNVNIVALSTLNTMSVIMSILSILSSIIMIIIDRQKDIAIMKLISIKSKAIRKAFRFELKSFLLIPLIIGALTSIPIAKYLLTLKNVETEHNYLMYVVLGFVFYAIIYSVFINIATGTILEIKPLTVIRDEKVSYKKSFIKIGVQSVLFTILAMILYAMYIGKGASLISSFIIIAFIFIFFIITLLFIKILLMFKFKNNLITYTFKNIKSNSFSFTLTVLSIALTLWFILFGFSMETTIKESYNSGIQEKISYQYMMVSDDVIKAEDELNNSTDVNGYTKLNREIGTFISSDNNIKITVILCNINKDKYDQKFNVIRGQDLFEGLENDVLISENFSNQINKKIGEKLNVWINEEVISLNIIGIYESGGVNDNFILKAMNGKEPNKNILFLVNADNENFMQNLKNASIVNIDIMGLAILKMINEFLIVFKFLCFICIIASILFNLNMIYMNYING